MDLPVGEPVKSRAISDLKDFEALNPQANSMIPVIGMATKKLSSRRNLFVGASDSENPLAEDNPPNDPDDDNRLQDAQAAFGIITVVI